MVGLCGLWLRCLWLHWLGCKDNLERKSERASASVCFDRRRGEPARQQQQQQQQQAATSSLEAGLPAAVGIRYQERVVHEKVDSKVHSLKTSEWLSSPSDGKKRNQKKAIPAPLTLPQPFSLNTASEHATTCQREANSRKIPLSHTPTGGGGGGGLHEALVPHPCPTTDPARLSGVLMM